MSAQVLRETAQAVNVTEASGGRMLVDIITPGWGSCGYYSKETLQEAATSNVFGKGLHMYLDHPTAADEHDRPERSVRDLAGVLDADAVVTESGSLQATVRVFSQYRDVIAEMSDSIGVSIRAMGEATNGEAEGRKGPLITSLSEAMSVDFVTQAGRGGKIAALLESKRALQLEALTGETATNTTNTPASTPPAGSTVGTAPAPTTTEETKVATEDQAGDQARELTEAHAKTQGELAEARSALARYKARDAALPLIGTRIDEASTKLQPAVRQRVVESTLRDVPVKDGQLDVDELNKRIDSTINAESQYAAQLLGAQHIPNVFGVAASQLHEAGDTTVDPAQTDRVIAECFGRPVQTSSKGA